MCSELDNNTTQSTKPQESNDKQITFEQGTNDAMSESEDDDIGSEELMCNENIDVNDKESDDSDDEELTNRVFPQQRFSPVPFAGRRSQTPDIGKIRYSPIEFPAKRAVTPNIYEQMVAKNHSQDTSGKPLSKMVDFNFRAPKGLPHTNKSMDRTSENTTQSGQFVRPKLPMTKSHSPGLTVSGYFQPTGSVFRPSQPSSSSASSKVAACTIESAAKAVVSSSDVSYSSFSEPVPFPSNFTKFSPATNLSSPSNAAHGLQVKSPGALYKGGSHTGLAFSTNQNTKVMDSASIPRIPINGQKGTGQSHAENVSIPNRPQVSVSSATSVSTSVPLPSQVTWSGASTSSFLAPLTVAVATHTAPPFHQTIKSTPALSPVAKGVQLKAIAPMLSPPLMATSPTGEKPSQRILLAKKPAGHPAGQMDGNRNTMVVDVKQGFLSHGGLGYCNISPATLNASAPLLRSPTKTVQGSYPRPAHVPGSNVSPRPAPLSPRVAAPSASLLLPKGGKLITEACPKTEAATTSTSCVPVHTSSHSKPQQDNRYEGQATLEQSVGQTDQQVARPILKRFIADGMEE